MKLSKLLLGVVGAMVLLGALVASASAGRLSSSSQTTTALWRAMHFSGTLSGRDVICEVKLSGSLHTRTITKTVNSLIGYITEGTVLRCAEGSATINQSSLPWHRKYRGFTGALPAINTQSETVTGAEWNIREPGGFSCTVSRTNSSTIGTATREAGGAITRDDVSGSSTCGGFFTGSLSGSETNVTNGSGGRITVTLI